MKNALDIKINLKSLLKFAFPTIIMMFVMSLYTVVDGIFVSQLIGNSAFAAVNIIYPLSSIIIAMGTMFGAGMVAIVSRKLGEGSPKEAREIISFIMLVSLVVSIIIATISLIFLPQIVRLLGSNNVIYEYCYAYAFSLIFFFPASILQLQFQNLFIANGKSHLGLALTISGGLVNIVLDYVFIAVFNMGISGAAIATGLGYCVPTVFGIIYFTLARKNALYFVKPKRMWKSLLTAMTNGSSEMVTFLSTSITTIMFNLLMMKFIGENGVAAVAVILYLDFLLVAISLGFCMGIAPLIGYNYGNGDTEKLKRINKLGVKFSFVVGTFIAVAAFLLAPYLPMIFIKPQTQVYDLAVEGLRIFSIGYLFKSYNIYASSLFTALSNGKVSAILSFMRTLVFLVLALFILSALFGVTGVWVATPISELLSLVLCIFFVSRYKKVYNY